MTRQIGRGGGGGSGGSSTELLYSGSVGGGDAWTGPGAYPAMPTARGRGTAAVIGDTFYVPGGYDANDPVADFEAYDASAETWTTGLPDMPAAREMLASAALDGYVYVSGGKTNANDAADTLYRYDPDANTWDTMAPMPAGKKQHVMVAGNGYLWVAGGTKTAVFYYDPAADSWTNTGTQLPVDHSAMPGAAYIDGKLYVGGGITANPAGSVYDPAEDTATSMTGPSIRHANGQYREGDGKIYFPGGYKNGGWISSIWAWDPIADTFTQGSAPSIDLVNLGRGSGFDSSGNMWVFGAGPNQADDNVLRYAPPALPPVELSEDRLVSLRDAPSTTAELENKATGRQGQTIAGKAGDQIDVTEAGDAEIYGI